MFKLQKSVVLILCVILQFSKLVAQEEPIVLNGVIEGTLALPENKNNLTVVLIIAGSGPTDRNGNNEAMENNSLKLMATELMKNGIASVRFDKRGVARSRDAAGSEESLIFDDFVNDVKDWIELLSKDKRFSKIIVAGHSEGSLIGMIASANNKNVKGYISIAGPGRPADEVIKEQLSSAPPSVQEIIFPMIDSVKLGKKVNDVPVIFASLLRTSVQPYMTSWFKYNPQEEIKKLNIPIMIMQGTTDIQVKEKDAELLAKAQPKAKLEIIKNMNHVLKDCDTVDKEKQVPIYSNPDLPLNKDFSIKLIEFIKEIK